MSGSALKLPPAKADVRRLELHQVLGKACALAEDENADALLIPGDRFDDEAASFDDIGFAIEQFGRMTRPVIIAPGNHDYASPSSFYESGFLSVRFNVRWPDNVHIFRRQSWEQLRLPSMPGVCITGLAFETHIPLSERLLNRRFQRLSDELAVLLFHGSRQAFAPQGKLMTLPFTDTELRESGCDYAAIGHYHDFTPIESDGRIIGAYSGCPAGRGLDECGQKVVLKVEIDDERRVAIEPVRVDGRQVARVRVDCSGTQSNESIVGRIETRLNESACVVDDIVWVELTGTVPAGLSVQIPERFLADQFFHISVDAAGLRPAYDLDRFANGGPGAGTTEGRFVLRLVAEMQRAEARGDVEQALVLRQAIEYGLDALQGHKVRPRGID